MGKFDSVLICSDVDGTLAEGAHVFQKNIEAIEKFTSEGGKFCICSGRGKDYIANLEGITYNAPFISMNGTLISDCFTGENLLKLPLSDEMAIPIIRDYVQYNWPQNTLLSVWSETTRIGNYEEVKSTLDYLDKYGTQGKDIQKLVFGFKDKGDAARYKEWAEKRYPNVTICRSWWEGVEILDKKAGKGICMNWLKKHLNCKYTIAIGDQENDLSMLTKADFAFCPSNATDDVKTVCNQVLCDFREGAIWDLIQVLPSYL